MLLGEKVVKIIKRIINILTCILGAWYLMKLVDEITLSTSLQKVLIYFYFLLSLGGIIYTYYSKVKITKESKKRFVKIKIISVLIGFFILISFRSTILPREYEQNEILIKVTNDKNDMSQGYECWITNIEVDGIVQDLSKYDIGLDWQYKADSNLLYTNAVDSEKVLKLNLEPAKSITISFVKHAWSGKVEINSKTYNGTIDLFDSDGNQQTCNISGYQKEISSLNKYLLFAGFLLLIIFILNIVLIWCNNKFHTKKN